MHHLVAHTIWLSVMPEWDNKLFLLTFCSVVYKVLLIATRANPFICNFTISGTMMYLGPYDFLRIVDRIVELANKKTIYC